MEGNANTMLDVLYRLRSFTLMGLAIAWQAGILLDSLLHASSFALMGSVIVTFLSLLLFYRDPQGRIAMLLVLCTLAGAWRYSSMLPDNDAQAISAFISSTPVSIQGTVADEPKLQGRLRVLIVEATTISQGTKTHQANQMNVHGKVEVQILGANVEDSYGANYSDTIELQGKLQPPSPYTPPGVFASMLFPRVHVTSSGGDSLIGFLYHMRNRYATLILQVLPQPAAALLVAIVLGLRTPGLAPLKSAFNVTGTAHLIVPSGFKVTILAGLVVSNTRWLYRLHIPGQHTERKQWQGWTVTTLLLMSIAAYTILSGAGPAAIRAGIMGCLLVLAPRIGRSYNVYAALALSGTLMSAIDPFVLWDTGFQLSFLGTLGIVLLTPYFQSLLSVLKPLPLGHISGEMIAVTMAAQIATLPIFAITFQQISFIAPLANLLTVPLLGVFIALGAMICGVGLLSLPLAQICAWVAWPLLTYVSNCILWCAALPGAYLQVTSVTSGLAWAYYLLLGYVTSIILRRQPGVQEAVQKQNSAAGNGSDRRRTWHIIQLSAACLFIAATGIAATWQRGTGELSITFLNVGPTGEPPQGEAIFIRTPENKTALIDGGMDATSLAQALDSRLPYWQRSLDMVILTTPRNDHLGGLQDVITRYKIGSIRDAGMLHPTTTYARWRRTISERALSYTPIGSGETIPLGTDMTLQILWPQGDMHKGSNEVRDNGLIIRLLAPGLRVLLLGAAAQSSYALKGLTEQFPSNSLQSEIVQIMGEQNTEPVPEMETIMQEAQPALVIVTPGQLSAAQKKAPQSSSVDTIEKQPALAGRQVLRTGQVGSVEIRSSSMGWTMETG